VYQGVQGACPRQAVTSAGGTAERQRAPCRRHGSKACYHYLRKDLYAACHRVTLVKSDGDPSAQEREGSRRSEAKADHVLVGNGTSYTSFAEEEGRELLENLLWFEKKQFRKEPDDM
jgi:hypothetical protein